MRTIFEEQFEHRTIYYKVEYDEFANEISRERFDCRTYDFRNKEGKRIIFIGDKYQMIRPKPFRYLNEDRRGINMGTRKQMATALNFFYVFCDIYGIDPENAESKDIENFSSFMLGYDMKAMPGSEVTYRNTKTVKGYLGMISSYFKCKGISKEAFNDTRIALGTIDTGGGIHMISRVQKYGNNLRSGFLDKQTAPDHFTPKQAGDILRAIKKHNDTAINCIFRFGYAYGMRRGEILGLTLEDLIVRNNNQTNEKVYEIIIRNRVNDKEDQHAKTLIHPYSADQYKSAVYKSSKWVIEIEKDFYDKILNYYQESRFGKNISKEKSKIILERTVADSVKPNKSKDQNYYIFDISGQSVNNHLKKYFKECNLRFKNASHVMRHSFAMTLTEYFSIDRETLRKLMRHSSPMSTAIYYNMTEEKKREHQNNISKELMKLVPEFK